MSLIVLVVAAVALAAANGANDNFKGVATLLGGGVTSYRTSLGWASLTTLAGALAAAFVGTRLAIAFTGDGMLPGAATASPVLLPAVAVGAALTVAVASRVGLPISTTHAILGALIGAGAMASGGHLHLGPLSKKFVAPLLFSPVAALLLTALVHRAGAGRPRPAGARSPASPASGWVAGAHFLTAGLQSFARGLNDTPKIAALLLGVSRAGVTGSAGASCATVALAMAAGGWFGARRVAETMSHRITRFDEGQALASNAVTAGLVLAASAFALPVSMTHVAVGSLAGLGWSRGEASWSPLRRIALAWLATLPLAALIAAAAYRLGEAFVS